MKRLRSDVGNLLIESVAKVRRYSIAQQLLHGPHMVRQSCCHSRCDQLGPPGANTSKFTVSSK